LHRLALLGIPWGVPAKPRVQQAGTYAETWTLQWLPDLSLKVVEAAIWGNTVRDAAAARVGQQAAEQTELPPLIELVDRVIQADLPEVIPAILTRIEELAVVNRDGGHAGVAQMLAALPPLADVLRYGGLR